MFKLFPFLRKINAPPKFLLARGNENGNRVGQDLLLLQRRYVDMQENWHENPGACSSGFLQKGWGGSCCHPSMCNRCFSSCKWLCKQGTAWAVPAAGAADPHLIFKGGNCCFWHWHSFLMTKVLSLATGQSCQFIHPLPFWVSSLLL